MDEITEATAEITQHIEISLSGTATKQLFAINLAANLVALSLFGGARIYARHKIRQISARRAHTETNTNDS